MCVLENGHMGQIYFGKKIHDKEDFSYLVEKIERPMTSYIYEWDKSFSLEHIRRRISGIWNNRLSSSRNRIITEEWKQNFRI